MLGSTRIRTWFDGRRRGGPSLTDGNFDPLSATDKKHSLEKDSTRNLKGYDSSILNKGPNSKSIQLEDLFFF